MSAAEPAEEPVEPEPLSAIIEAGALEKSVEIADTAGDESVMRFGREGLACRLVDPGNVYMADVQLDASAFQSVGDGVFPAGIYHNKLLDFIGKADAEQLVELSFDTETRYLSVRFDPFDREFALIDPDSIRDEPDIPDLEFPNRFEIDAATLKDVVDVSEMVSDHVRIEGSPDDECVRFVADGDIDSNTATLDEELSFADVTESCDSLVSLDYIAEAIGVIPKPTTVEIGFGEEQPIKLFWEFDDGRGEVEQMIAPRIENS